MQSSTLLSIAPGTALPVAHGPSTRHLDRARAVASTSTHHASAKNIEAGVFDGEYFDATTPESLVRSATQHESSGDAPLFDAHVLSTIGERTRLYTCMASNTSTASRCMASSAPCKKPATARVSGADAGWGTVFPR